MQSRKIKTDLVEIEIVNEGLTVIATISVFNESSQLIQILDIDNVNTLLVVSVTDDGKHITTLYDTEEIDKNAYIEECLKYI